MFENISFEVKKGEILGFSGLVGAGRSELMQTIFGIHQVDRGTLIFENKQLNIRSPEQAIKVGIAYLPEDRSSEGLFLNFSIIDNIRISILKRLKKNFGFIDEDNSLKLANDYLKLLEIKAPSVFSKVKNLSGGNQQKVLISKWLATTPKLLILDEPTRGVDVAVKSEIHELIFSLAAEGLSIILISSELPEILKLSDRVIVMHEGIISGVFEKEDINETNLIKASIGENIVLER
jgi:ABC-type sugar transport system ATPase subunit